MHSILKKKSLYHKYIVLTGPERCLVDYVQSDRRSGRNEEQVHDVAIYRGHQLAQCDLNIKEFVKANECIRKAIFKHFSVDIESVTPVHQCFSNCPRKCDFEQEDCKQPLPFEKTCEENEAARPEKVRTIRQEERNTLIEALLEEKAYLDAG